MWVVPESVAETWDTLKGELGCFIYPPLDWRTVSACIGRRLNYGKTEQEEGYDVVDEYVVWIYQSNELRDPCRPQLIRHKIITTVIGCVHNTNTRS